MLKHCHGSLLVCGYNAAAFGRLCVETCFQLFRELNIPAAAAFGRLCVETEQFDLEGTRKQAAAFGRLCVETVALNTLPCTSQQQPPSGGCVLKPLKQYAQTTTQDAAAFGRLCVETTVGNASPFRLARSRLRAAVC